MAFGIAAGHKTTRDVARLILDNGGNAIDAAIAAYLTMFISEPAMASAGACGFAAVHTANGENKILDFFSQTPGSKNLSQDPDFYPVNIQFEDDSEEFHIGLASATVPGAIAGIHALHDRYGTIPLKELYYPAIQKCREGVALDKFQAYDIFLLTNILNQDSQGRKVFFENEKIKKENDIIRMDKAADFLDFLSLEGSDAFYKGEIARSICQDCEERGGYLRRSDFENYKVHIHDPLLINWDSYTIGIPGFPSIGSYGLSLYFGLTQKKSWSDAKALKFTAETIRNKNKVLKVLTELYPETPISWHDQLFASKGTSHFSIIDNLGNAIALTSSIGEGCGYFIPGTQMHLNNMLGETYLLDGGAHSWQPNVRLNSMMCPTLVFKDKELFMVSGSGGASRIPVAITQVIKNIIIHDMHLTEATEASRIHYQDGFLHIESGYMHPVDESAYNIKRWNSKSLFFGGVNSVAKLGNHIEAAADQRRFASAGVYD